MEPVWRRGFFTGRRHAVVDVADRIEFHGMLLGWSVCNRPVVLGDAGDQSDAMCFHCAIGAAPPSGPGARREEVR